LPLCTGIDGPLPAGMGTLTMLLNGVAA
jgi:hypothetical protein